MDMHELDTNTTAVCVAQSLEDLAQSERLSSENGSTREGPVEVRIREFVKIGIELAGRTGSRQLAVERTGGTLNVRLFDRTMAAGGIQVLIGAEAKLPDTRDLSLITAPFGREGLGTLGVIAPTRTDYQKVVPLVGFAASLLTDLLEQQR